MTFIAGEIIDENKNLKVQSEIFGQIAIDKSRVFGQSSKRIVLGIRPEKISIVPKSSRSKNLVSGKIIDVSYFGETTNYKVSCGNTETLTISSQNSVGQLNYSVGEEIQLKADMDNIIAFSA